MSELFTRMRQNPAGDWTMQDVITLCRQYGVRCSSPTGGGSHYKVSHPRQRHILTIPYRKPIKPVYIRALVRLVAAVAEDADGAS
jgi:hypothetical protein